MPNETKGGEEANKKEDNGASKNTTREQGVEYTSDGAVVGDSDRLNGEEALAPPPPPFVQYGGPTEESGDGFRRPGSFRAKFGCRSALFSNMTAIPFRRVG